jgi:hypothetical protein
MPTSFWVVDAIATSAKVSVNLANRLSSPNDELQAIEAKAPRKNPKNWNFQAIRDHSQFVH